MNTRQHPGEPEHREGLGGRVRRFVDTELNRVLDKGDRGTDWANTEDLTTSSPRMEEPPKMDEPPKMEASPKIEEVEPPQPPGHSSDQAAADSDGRAERVGLLDDPAGLREEWQRIQGTFVDDPQRAVHEASALVDQTLQEIHKNVTRGQTSDPISTEDLRVSFQRYREFFYRLLSA
jgi:hypothetical protein